MQHLKQRKGDKVFQPKAFCSQMKYLTPAGMQSNKYPEHPI